MPLSGGTAHYASNFVVVYVGFVSAFVLYNNL
jgi:hypothetical protein